MMMAPPIRKPRPEGAAKAMPAFPAPLRPLLPWQGLEQGAWAPNLLQRKCACGVATPGGGTCASCAEEKDDKSVLQRKLAIGSSSDPLEHEADRVAEQVMAGPSRSDFSQVPVSIQRLAPGAAPGAGQAPASVDRVLASSGRTLDAPVRRDMETRFGHDFSQVRVHQGAAAEQSARDVGAIAYTVGSNIVFGEGQYRPETSSGRFTLAHELAHVVQQQGGGALSRRAVAGSGAIAIGRADDSAEAAADRAAEAALQMSTAAPGTDPIPAVRLGGGGAPVLRRRLVVNPKDKVPVSGGKSQPLTTAVGGLIKTICPSGPFTVAASTGVVTGASRFCEWHPPIVAGKAEADISRTPVGCRCICDVINEAKTTTIAFVADDGPIATPTSPTADRNAVPGSGGIHSNVTVSIDPRFKGQYRINGKWVDVPFHLLFAHEVCGHARSMMRGTEPLMVGAPPGGTDPGEQHAVDVERAVAAEYGLPLPRRPDDYNAARKRP